ncbi:MAG: conjugal transfer protein TraN [Rhizobiales bacterium]|nr:conjugal transfer protein TraN [Hyphomicrobiales bacterium]
MATHADEIDEAAIDGGNFATTIFPDATVDADGNVTIGGAGEEGAIAPADLFPDDGATDPDAFTTITSEEDAAEAGRQARAQESDVIDVVDDTNAQDRDDLAKDPFLDATDDVFGSIDELGQEFGACTTTRDTVPTTHVATLPEERFCERIRKVEGNCRITHRIEIDPTAGVIATDVWEPPECMVAASHAIGPSTCRGEITLVEGAALGQCLEAGGRTICPGDPLYEQLTPPPFDGHEQRISRLALAVDVGPLDCDTHLDAIPCITTSTGRTVCPTDEGEVIDTCGGLREDPACSFVAQGCVAGAEVNEVCYLEELRFACDREVSYRTYQQQTALSCSASAIRCSGNECLAVDNETNGNAANGLAALTASQLLTFDTTCLSLDPDSCTVFPGTAQACQRGIGGIFDACELPAAPGPGPYLDLVFLIGALDTHLTALSPTSPLRGAWETLRDPKVTALESLKTPFASVSNTVSAGTVPNADHAFAEQDLARLRQDLLNGVADEVLESLGAGAMNALFVNPAIGSDAADENGRLGDVALRRPPPGETPLALVANAYGVAASEAYPAEPEPLVDGTDVATAAHDDAQNCLFVGTQCTPDSFGACISRERSSAASTPRSPASPRKPRRASPAATSARSMSRTVAD